MILILSSAFDQSTNIVTDWLKLSVIRINRENHSFELNIVVDSKNTHITQNLFDTIQIDAQKITAYWYRRDDFILNVDYNENNLEANILNKEWEKLNNFLHRFYENKLSIGSRISEDSQNKIEALFLAKSIGLEIPPTLITTQKTEINKFILEHGECISKAISNMFKIELNGFPQIIAPNIVTSDMIRRLEEAFFPFLIQKKIEKVFELRIFYMHGQFYTMAIFSQNDQQTKLDYRNYNREKPNRNIPYILPEDIKEKLQLLMDKLDLNTGSIDMIVTPEGEYVFLEVNPTGQFGWVSDNCNYYLEEKIANHLQGA